jgi:trimeric autotransporter adhesin
MISATTISPLNRRIVDGGAPPFSFGNALQFDGANDYTNTAFSSANLGASFTIGGWFKLDSSISVPSCIYLFGDTPNDNTPYIYTETTASGMRFYVNKNYRISITINRDEWHYISLNYSSSNWSIYVDGVSQDTYSGGLGNFLSNNFYLGGPLVSNAKVTIDEFAIWGTELTPTQISNQYNSGNGNFANADVEPLIWYNMNESDGETTITNSGSGGATYDGTLNNFSTPPAYFIPH